MDLLFNNHWLIIVNSIIFWFTPVLLAINLALVKNKPNSYKKKLGYFYGTLWAIAFIIYGIIFLR